MPAWPRGQAKKCALGWLGSTVQTLFSCAAEKVDYQAANRDRRVARPRLPTFPWVSRRQQSTRSQVTRLCHGTYRYGNPGGTIPGYTVENSLFPLRSPSVVSEKRRLITVSRADFETRLGAVQHNVRHAGIRGANAHQLRSALRPLRLPVWRFGRRDPSVCPSCSRCAGASTFSLFPTREAIRQGPGGPSGLLEPPGIRLRTRSGGPILRLTQWRWPMAPALLLCPAAMTRGLTLLSRAGPGLEREVARPSERQEAGRRMRGFGHPPLPRWEPGRARPAR